CDSNVVMIAHRPRCPPGSERFFGRLNGASQERSAEGALHKLEAIAAIQMFTALSVLRAHRNHVNIGNFSDEIALAILVGHRSEFRQCLKRSRLVTAKNHLLPIKWVATKKREFGIFRVKRARGIASQLQVMAKGSDRIEAQSIHSRIQPEPDLVVHCNGNFRVMPVQVWLLSQEMMQVILLAPRFPLPSRSAERRYPVIWSSTVGLRIGPTIPIRLCVSSVTATLLEPAMLIRGVCKHHIDNHFQTSLMRCTH